MKAFFFTNHKGMSPLRVPTTCFLQAGEEKLDPEDILGTIETDGSDCKFIGNDDSLSSSGASRFQWGKI